MRYEKVSLDKFDDMVNDWNATLNDAKVPLSDVIYKVENRSLSCEQETVFGMVANEGVMTHRGWRTLCSRLDCPSKWLESEDCPPDLNQTIIDRLKRDEDKPSLLRFRTGHDHDYVRAVLSDRYMVYNHLDLWNTVKAAIERSRLSTLSPMVWKPHIDDYMQAWVLFDGVIADPDNPIDSYDGGGAGGLKPAIHIRNSEDGGGKVGVKSGLYRSYCDNGVIFGFQAEGMMEAVHLGNSQHLVSARIEVAIGEAVRLAGDGIEQYLSATHEHITTGLDEIVDRWATQYKMADDTTEQWKGFVGRSRTWADLVMATSDFGGTLKDPEAQTEFEELSGALLMANRRQYVEVR